MISAFESRASYFASVHQYYGLYIRVLMLRDRQDPALRHKEMALMRRREVKFDLCWIC
jgi:hypothetical protein